jgi:hypothetical protein
VERLLLGVVLGSLAVGCASVEYRIPASEMVRLAQEPPEARGNEIRVVPASTPIGPALTAEAVAPAGSSVLLATQSGESTGPASAETVVVETGDSSDDDDAPVDVPDVAIAVDVATPAPRPLRPTGSWHNAALAPKMVATPVRATPARVAPVRAAVAGAPPARGFGGSGGNHGSAGGGDAGALAIVALVVLPIVIVALVAEAAQKAADAAAFNGWVSVSPDHIVHLRYGGDLERLVPLATLCPSDLVGVRYAILREKEGPVERRAQAH